MFVQRCDMRHLYTRESQKFYIIIVAHASIMVVGAPAHCVLLESMYDLKAAEINVQRNQIRELMHYE